MNNVTTINVALVYSRVIEGVMNEREKTIEETKDKMNTVEDRFVEV